MEKLFSLDNRLMTCAGFVRKGTKLADIGTDHAYLPIWLAKKKLIASGIAADIRPLPLKSGKENIEKYNCSDIITTRLSDGLDEIGEREADDIVIAGMGGEVIAEILGRTPWIRNPGKRLILQPMTKEFVLREFLCSSGFEILKEKACTHGGKNYTVIHAAYSAAIKEYPPSFHYIGMLDEKDELSKKYMFQILKKLRFKSDGAKHDGKDSTQIDGIIEEITARFGDDSNDNG